MKIAANRISLFFFGLLLQSDLTMAANGKLLGTPGVATIEGSAGGGLVPWAQLAGYASRDEISASGYCSQSNVKDFTLNSCGLQINLFDRLELAAAQQNFTVEPLNVDVSQKIISAKLRVYGDIIYSRWPQISLGLQAKTLKDPWVIDAFGSVSDKGTDIYIAASKLHLAAIVGRNAFWNITLRSTQANQLGLLGFGSQDHGRQLQIEASSALFLNPHWAIGLEYRQKPNNLAIPEDDWADLFIAWFPSKRINVTAAFLDLGEIAGIQDQTGWHLSLMANY